MVEKNDYEAFMWVNNEWQMLNNELITVKNVPEDYLDEETLETRLSNYYNSTEIDNLLDDKADVSDTYTKTEVDDLLDDKADNNSVYSKTEVDNLIGDINTYLGT